MFFLALRSVRQRPGRFIATLLAALLGAAIVMMFYSLLDTAGVAGIDDTSHETLLVTATVVGGYGSLLILFSIVSTLTMNVRQRTEELSLLRSTGATPGQIARMVVGEAVVVALVAVVFAVAPAMLGGRLLVEEFHDTGQVAKDVGYTFGPIGIGAGIGITVVASAVAAWIAVRRAQRAMVGRRRSRGRLRLVAGLLALVLGIGGAATTFTLSSTEPALMAPAAYGSILVAAGLAALSPVLLRVLVAVLQVPVRNVFGASGYLAVLNLRQRAGELTGVLMPMTMFVGLATATLYMQAVEDHAQSGHSSVDDQNLETVNVVVVAIIAAFACLMLINTLYAATTYRRREFGQERLAGAAGGQVLQMITAEAGALTAVGVVLGTAAALTGIIPFTMVRTHLAWPDQGPWIWLAIVAVAGLATAVTSLMTASRALRIPATEVAA